MATWPSTLPAPSLSGYQLAPVDPALRTEMESGAPRARRRTYSRNDRLHVSWIFNDAQMAAFRAWFESDVEAAGGAAWFYIALRIGDTGATTEEARFTGMWQAALVGFNIWNVSASIEVR